MAFSHRALLPKILRAATILALSQL